MRYNIYHKNGTKLTSTNNLEYTGELMGERYLNVSIVSPFPLAFQVGDYIDYRGERFEIKDAVATKKQASPNKYGKGFEYNNVKFDSFINELKNCLFLNVTYTNESTSSVGGSLMSSFSFHANNVCDLASRILANLNRIYTGDKAWQVKVLGKKLSTDTDNSYYNATESLYSVVGESNVEVSVDGTSVYEALKQAYDTFGVRFIIDKTTRIIRICSAGEKVNHIFKYGKGNGLRSIEKTINNDSEIITVLHAYGSEKNMPRHYYYYKALKGTGYKAKVNISTFTQEGSWFTIPSSVTIKNQIISMVIEVDSRSITCNRVSNDTTLGEVVASMTNTFEIANASDVTFIKNILATQKYVVVKIADTYIEKCNDSVKVWNASTSYASLLPISCLMPSAFGINNLNPTFEANVDKYGIREKVVKFDTEDKDNGIEEVYPTIETLGRNKVVTGSTIADDGIFDTNTNIPNFTITTDDLGFDLNDTRPDGQTHYGKLCMKDGMCGGREFEIVKYNATNHTITLKRAEDSSLNVWFPNAYYQISANDKFVITEIEMPDSYVVDASTKLDTLARKYLAEHCQPKYTYNIVIDNIFMARQHDTSTQVNSFYYNVKEGDLFNLGKDDDIEHSADELIAIDKLIIKESPDNIPQYTINLRNEKKKGTIASVRQDIDKANENANTAIEIANGNRGLGVDDVNNLIGSAIDNIQFTTSGNNLLVNSGFTGDYDSAMFESVDEITSDTEVYSPALDGWTTDSAEAIESTDSKSKCACQLDGGNIQQEVKVIVNETYIFSLNGSGTFVFSFGGYAEKISLDNERMYYKFTATENEKTFRISGTGTIYELMLERGEIASNEWTPSSFDNSSELARLQSIQYITNAIKEGSTSINGGLILSNLIELGNYVDGKMQTVTSGLSGIYTDDSDVCFWGGGTLAQAMKAVALFKSDPHYTPTDAEWNSIAKVCITHGGRAILSDIILKGSIYADSGYFKGMVEALSGKLGNLSLNGKLEFDAGNGVKLQIDTTTNLPQVILYSDNDHYVKLGLSGRGENPYMIASYGTHSVRVDAEKVQVNSGSTYQMITPTSASITRSLNDDSTKVGTIQFGVDANGVPYVTGYNAETNKQKTVEWKDA